MLKYYSGFYTAPETLKMKTANGIQLIRKICFHHYFLRCLCSLEDVVPGTLCAHHPSQSWKTGKLPVLGRESCSCRACSYLGRATILCRSLKAQQSGLTPELLPLTNPHQTLQLLGLGILGREEILLALVPAKLRLPLSPYSPACRLGCPALPSPELLAGRRRSHQSAERGGCKIQAAGK